MTVIVLPEGSVKTVPVWSWIAELEVEVLEVLEVVVDELDDEVCVK